MSDNVANINNFTGCPYCCGSYSTAGFIHEINCPAMQGRQAIPGGSPIKKQAGDATTRGDTICPICGDAYFRCDHYPNSLISEIARLKAALEKAESVYRGTNEFIDRLITQRDQLRGQVSDQENIITQTIQDCDEARLALEKAERERDEARAGRLEATNIMFHFLQERDEARRWARRFYRLYLVEQKNYLNINDDENIWF